MNLHKYPRTLHLPWSEHVTTDDKKLPTINVFENKEVVVTEKLDGENSSMYNGHYHARSLNSRNHPSRNFVKGIHGSIEHAIPDGWRVCGENVYAKHSIHYSRLSSYFYVFGTYDENNTCLSWDETVDFCNSINLEVAPTLYRGLWDEKEVMNCYTGESVFGGKQEGYVVRLANSFPYDEFSDSVAKMVRKDHVQTSKFWMNEQIIVNGLQLGQNEV